jgi:hypothetical protein
MVNIDRDKQLNIAYRLVSLVAITLITCYSNFTITQSIFTVMNYHKFEAFKRQTMPRAARFGIEAYQSTNCF